MKRLLKIFFLVFVIASATTSYATEKQLNEAELTDIKNSVLQPFFTALKNGDVNTIKDYLSKDSFSSYQVLLEKNKGYADFLRKYYKGAKFRPITAVQLGDTVAVNVEIIFSDGTTSFMDLNLKNSVNKESRILNKRTWKVDPRGNGYRENAINNNQKD